MGWLSALGKIGGAIAGVAGAPFTGGASLLPTILSTAGDVGDVMGSASGAAGKGRADEMSLLNQRDRNMLSAADVDLARRKYALQAPRARMGNAISGDMLAGLQDVSVSHPRANVVHFGGGIRPSLLSADTRAMGPTIRNQAIAQQLAGDNFDPLALSDLPQPSIWEKIGRVGGIAGSLGGAVSPYLKKSATPYLPGIPTTPPR